MSKVEELNALIQKWVDEEKQKEQPFVEPCPVCGGEMIETSGGALHKRELKWGGAGCDGYEGPPSLMAHNAIAKVIKSAIALSHRFAGSVWAEGDPRYKAVMNLQDSVLELEKIQRTHQQK